MYTHTQGERYVHTSNNNNKEKIKPKQLVNFCHLKFIKRRLRASLPAWPPNKEAKSKRTKKSKRGEEKRQHETRRIAF